MAGGQAMPLVVTQKFCRTYSLSLRCKGMTPG